LVYQVKKVNKKKPGRKPEKMLQAKAIVADPAKIAAASSNGHLGVGASIAVAKAAADKVGGWASLKEIVDALA
jgi:hypothetical protein